MSQDNVQKVRRFFEATERSLEQWPRPSRSLEDAVRAGDLPPATREALAYLSPEFEWSPIFSGETYRGFIELARGWDELIEATESYALELIDADDLGGDRVFVVFGPTLEGRSSGINVDAAVFAVVTLRDGLIVRMEEYTDRRAALEAAGRSE